MRRGGLMAMVVALVVVGSVVPAAAQVEEPGAVVVATQIPDVLSLGATGCNFSPGSPVGITFSGGGASSREFSRQIGDDTCFSWSPPNLDPCRLGGSDLPGARYTVTVNVEADGYSLDQLITLEADTAGPRFLEPPFNASPKPGDKVEAGDEIGFEVTAVEQNPPRVWQTGVHTLEVTGPHGPIGRPQQAGANAKACEAKSKSLTTQGTYRVRRSDPAVIELCAVADDYVPNETKKCAKWYKGEVWEGTFSGLVPIDTIDICGSTFEGTLTLVVSKDGRVSGEAQWMYTSHTGPDEQCNMPLTGTYTYPVLASSATRDAFEVFLPFVSGGGDSTRIPKSGTRAQRDSIPGSQGEVYSVELRCVSC